ncbi:peritrophin-1-like [Anopheles albimanus]|uniref:Uncharacterized protein n=1 Tax=Anopheles albimanus TaxID=7167 RepID=A0A182F1W6_ANOAL|nr:peritrophin-1-like [Anopheles albimanus]
MKGIAVLVLIGMVAAVYAQETEQVCPEHDDIFNPVHFPHPTNCEKFYKCNNGQKFEIDCPAGLHWSVEKDYCDYPSEAGCVSAVP